MESLFQNGGMTQEVAALPVRAALGSTMVYHGLEKLRGEGPKETGQFFESVGIQPGRPWAVATGIVELGAGALALAGIGTRVAAAGVLVTQAMAIAKVHKDKGFANTAGGFEYNLALMAMAAGLLLAGPTKPSAKSFLARRMTKRRIPGWRAKEPQLLRWVQ